MNEVLSKIGEYNEVISMENNDQDLKEGIKKKKCLAACVDQQNNVAVTTSRLNFMSCNVCTK